MYKIISRGSFHFEVWSFINWLGGIVCRVINVVFFNLSERGLKTLNPLHLFTWLNQADVFIGQAVYKDAMPAVIWHFSQGFLSGGFVIQLHIRNTPQNCQQQDSKRQIIWLYSHNKFHTVFSWTTKCCPLIGCVHDFCKVDVKISHEEWGPTYSHPTSVCCKNEKIYKGWTLYFFY